MQAGLRLVEHPHRAIDIGLAAAVRAAVDVQRRQRDDEITQRAVVADGEAFQHVVDSPEGTRECANLARPHPIRGPALSCDGPFDAASP